MNLTNFTVHFLSINVDLMSHHVPGPSGYDDVMTGPQNVRGTWYEICKELSKK